MSEATRPIPARRLWLLAAAVAVVGVTLRLPSLWVPILNEDEALYASVAAAMEDGTPIYRAGVESKPPGVFYLYRAAFAVLGRYDMVGLHAATMAWVLATAAVVAWIARRVAARAARDRAALVAALLYLVFVTVHEPQILATQCELLYSLPVSLAAALWLLALDDAGRWRPLLSAAAGLLVALGTLVKPTAGALLGAALAHLLVLRPLLRDRRLLVDGLRLALGAVAGFAAAWALAALHFTRLGVWHDLVYWSFRWTTGLYIPTGLSLGPMLYRLAGSFLPWAALAVVLWLPAVLTLARAWRARREAPPRSVDEMALLGLWAGAAVTVIWLGGRFYDHYYTQAIPPLAVLSSTVIAARFGEPAMRRRWAWALGLGAALPALLCLLSSSHYRTAMRLLNHPRADHERLSAYLRDHSRPDERIFVWGYYPLLYVEAGRLPATRFVGCHYVTGYAAVGLGRKLAPADEDRLAVPGSMRLLLDELERDRPVLLVDTAPADLHGWSRYPLARYPQLAAYVADRYAPVATVDGAVVYRRRAPPDARR